MVGIIKTPFKKIWENVESINSKTSGMETYVSEVKPIIRTVVLNNIGLA